MSEANVNKKRKNRWAFPLGLVITVFAVIGLVCVILAGVNATKKAVIKSKNIDEYNTMLTPVVMNDPDPFDDITKANKNQLIDISVWSILKSNLSPDKYEYGEDGMIIPEEDVTAEFHKLFGTDTEPEHATVNGYGYTFTYDSAKHTYSIPLTGIVPTYTPDVIKVQKKSGAVVLTVGYLAGDQWAQNSEGDMVAPEPDKYMKSTLREKDGSYYINSIQATSSPETATTAVQPVTEAPTEAPETTSSAEAASETQPVSDGTDTSDTAAESDTASADTATAA